MKSFILIIAILFVAFANGFAATTINGAATAAAYNQGRLVIDNSITVSSSSKVNANTANITISGFVAGDSLILLNNVGVGNVSYDAATGIMTFSGSAWDYEWQEMFSAVMYSRSNISTASRTITFQLGGATFSKLLTNPTVLALTWVSFDAGTTGSNVALNWKTADEKNTAGFEVEHSADGRSFEKIGSLKSIGSGNNSYDFTDAATNNGTNYYRLKQTDNDGTFQYSKTVSAIVHKKAQTQVSIFPNPATNVLNVKSTIAVAIAVYNLNGALVASQDAATEASVNIAALPAGFYIYHLMNGNEAVQTGKIQVVK